MVPWLLPLLCLNPVAEYKVENLGIYLSRLSYGDVQLQQDGTVIGATRYQIWHWDAEGRLINRFGGKGEGPGEFQAVGEVLWTGEYYWAIDSLRLLSAIFDKNGRYLSTKPFYYRQFVRVEDRLFTVDISKFDPFRANYPRVLQEIRFQIEDGELGVEHTDFLFKKVSRRQLEMQYNFKLLWVVREGNRYLVVDQLEPKIRVYDPQAIEAERRMGDDKPFEPNFIPIQARHWVDPPDSMNKRINNHRDFKIWWHTWSRINYFGKAPGGYVVAFEIPNPDKPEDSLQGIQRLERDGRAVGELMMIDGYCIGVRGNHLYLFLEDEDTDQFNYYIRVYEW